MAKYQQYEEYKDSGVEWLGQVPSEWSVSPLKLYLNTRKGVAFKSADFTDIGIRVVKASDIKDKTIRQSEVFLPSSFSEIYPKSVLKEGEIIISTVGSTPDVKNSAVGQIGILPFELDGSLLNQNTVVLSPKNNVLSNLFLFYLIQTDVYREHLDLNAHGTANQASLNISDILNFTFARPTIQDQAQIANFLDHETAQIDTLIEKQQTLIQLLKEKRQAVISHAVTKGLNPDATMKDSDVEWLGEVPEHWEVKGIKRLSEIKRGASPRPIADQKYFDDEGEYAWTRIADVSRAGMYLDTTTQRLSDLGASLSVKLEAGELFLSIAGTVGKPCITISKACIHDGFVYFPTLKINNKFLFYIFEAGQAYLGLGKMGTQLNLNTETVGGIEIGLPPKKEIEAIIKYIEDEKARFNHLIYKAEQAIQLMQERRTALISAAVTGKIDVRGWRALSIEAF
ncbi:restriction endonuclease subunit S [Psychrobacter sp. NG254]|uniref:restriction endonuclease subunit S n=1 Tax=Psychrobacter sp. NG254 TaxID=2782003 RepID=UPI0018881776|nr:restriction endonuclease subunit S [Psychrobacter sp. NG254]MBF2720043.1 restriction endonuclease subunit S [Psychrobacter sp. NG254]